MPRYRSHELQENVFATRKEPHEAWEDKKHRYGSAGCFCPDPNAHDHYNNAVNSFVLL